MMIKTAQGKKKINAGFGELPIRLGAITSRTSQFMIADLLTILYSMRKKDRFWDCLEKSYV